jgi:hypothetical protein
MDFHGLEKIVRATGLVAATHGGAGDGLDHGIEYPLVKTDEDADQEAEESRDHDFASGRGKRPSRRACRTQSASNSAKVALEAPGRAMVTR